MQGRFSGMAQRLSSMLANTRGTGLTVSDLTDEYMLDGRVEQVLGRMGPFDPVPIEHINEGPFAGSIPHWDQDDRSHSRSHPIIDRWVNFYPSTEPAVCCSTLVVISLSGRNSRGNGHLKFEDALERIILHAQGVCEGVTRDVVLMTDSWNARDYQKWAVNLEKIKAHNVQFEAYLLGEMGRCSELQV